MHTQAPVANISVDLAALVKWQRVPGGGDWLPYGGPLTVTAGVINPNNTAFNDLTFVSIVSLSNNAATAMVNYFVTATDATTFSYRPRGPGGVSIFELDKAKKTYVSAFEFSDINLSRARERREA